MEENEGIPREITEEAQETMLPLLPANLTALNI
jgi:hypothetical protein